MELDVYMPLPTGHFIPATVMATLAEQTVTCKLIPCCTPGVITDRPDYDKLAKLAGECASRNLGLDMMIRSGKEYAAMQDRDVVHLHSDNYEKALDWLRNNEEYGALSMSWKPYRVTEHIRITALVIRIKAIAGIRFHYDYRKHLCITFTEDIKAAGFTYGFLPPIDRQLVEMI